MIESLLANLGAKELGLETLLLALAVLTLKDIGFPIPVPGDLLLISVGIAASGGGVPIAIVVAVLAAASIAGSLSHILLVRGPAAALIGRFGPRIGLTPDRLDSAARRFSRAGWPGVAVGRVVPGVRAVAVTACAIARLPFGVVVPGITVGGTAYVLLHVALGYLGGQTIIGALQAINVPLLPIVALLAAVGGAGWLALRRRSRPAETALAWADSCCPLCLAIAPLEKAILSGSTQGS